MEAAAWLAGEAWSDQPSCVPETIARFMRNWNDSLPDDRRDLLKPYIPRVIGLAKDVATEERRAWLAMDWLTRECAPAWLDLAGLGDHANAMRELPEITGKESYLASLDVSAAAWAAARTAGRTAARAAARAARDAALAAWTPLGPPLGRPLYAARAAAWDAARAAARTAALDAARAAALDDAPDAAAWDAARAAADKLLMPTRDGLIVSAQALLERMITA
jgi:hypothetical protein